MGNRETRIGDVAGMVGWPVHPRPTRQDALAAVERNRQLAAEYYKRWPWNQSLEQEFWQSNADLIAILEALTEEDTP